MASFDDLKALIERADVAIKRARHARDMVAYSGTRVGNLYLSGSSGNYETDKMDFERVRAALQAEDKAAAIAARDAQFIESAAEIRDVRRLLLQAVCDAHTNLSRIEERLLSGRPD